MHEWRTNSRSVHSFSVDVHSLLRPLRSAEEQSVIQFNSDCVIMIIIINSVLMAWLFW